MKLNKSWLKRFSLIMLACIIVGLIGGCASQSKDTPPASTPGEPTSEETASSDQTPAESPASGTIRGGTLIVGKIQNFVLDPSQALAINDDRNVTMQLYETLIDMDESGNYIPRLAESWEILDDTTIVFHLRKDVKFHCGEPFTAKAVKDTFDYYMSFDNRFTTNIQIIDSVEAVDDYTVKFKLKTVNASFLSLLHDSCGMILCPAELAKYGREMTLHACGTGPYKLKEYVDGSGCTVVRNPDYYEMGEDGKPLPYIDEIVFKVIVDDSVLMTNLRSGDVDIVESLSINSVKQLESIPEIVVEKTAASTAYNLYFNTTEAPYDNIKLRQAISYAIDHDEFVAVITQGIGEVAPFYVTPKQWFYIPEGGYKYDLEKAKQLMAEAGFPNGFDTKLISIAMDPDNTIVQLLQKQLAAIGINITIEPMDATAFRSFMAPSNPDTGPVMGLGKSSLPRVDMGIQMMQFGKDSTTNYSKFSTPEFSVMLENLENTYDINERKKAFAVLQEYFLDQAAAAFLFQQPKNCSYHEKVCGVTYDYGGSFKLREAWVK